MLQLPNDFPFDSGQTSINLAAGHDDYPLQAHAERFA
jgi:hypothetical protein